MTGDEMLAAEPARRGARLARAGAGPLAVLGLALAVSATTLLAVGVDPLAYAGTVLDRGFASTLGLQAAATRMAPLLLLAAALIVAFRAGLWNLGIDGQFLLGAVGAAALAPALAGTLPVWAMWIAGFAVAGAIGAAWALLPALLRAHQGVNEIVSSLMMTFLGLSLANALIKLVFLDPATTVPQTATLAVADRLPRLFDTTISGGLVVALAVLVAMHLAMVRTAFGLRLRTLGASPRAAHHAGLDVPRLTVVAFCLSGGLAGLAGAVTILGVHGTVQADWNPAYGLAVIPLVFLARLNGLAAVALVFAYAGVLIGSESAARRLGVPADITLVLVASLLIGLALVDHLGRRRRDDGA